MENTKDSAMRRELDVLKVRLASAQEDIAVLRAMLDPDNGHYPVLGWADLCGLAVGDAEAGEMERVCGAVSRICGLGTGTMDLPLSGRVATYRESVLRAVFRDYLEDM